MARRMLGGKENKSRRLDLGLLGIHIHRSWSQVRGSLLPLSFLVVMALCAGLGGGLLALVGGLIAASLHSEGRGEVLLARGRGETGQRRAGVTVRMLGRMLGDRGIFLGARLRVGIGLAGSLDP